MNKKERLENSMEQKRGRASILFEHPPVIRSIASVAGTKEGKGPLGSLFDAVEQDDKMGKENWEEAESAMQEKAARMAMAKAYLTEGKIDYCFAGDLLGQLIATSFGTGSLKIPLLGLYGACATMGEALGLGAMTVNAGYGENVLVMASSHFATAEKEFRFPLAYGNQRPKSATWTVTGCGAAVVGKYGEKGIARIAGITTGQVVDAGIRDSMNMGAAMAPAAFHTVMQNLKDLEITKKQLESGWYDKIITGDLGKIGKQALAEFIRNEGLEAEEFLMDCGMEIYDSSDQDTHAGGSGCGCSALVLGALILPNIQAGIWRRVLFIPTGALLLVSDQPMIPEGVKTDKSDNIVTQNYVEEHVKIGIASLRMIIDEKKTVKHLKFDW